MLIVCGISTAAESKDRLIPFDEVFVSVETNDWMRAGKPHFNVSVRLHRRRTEPMESTAIDVECFEFASPRRMMPDQDLKAFFDVSAFARQGQSKRIETVTPTYNGDEKTVFEGVSVDGKMVVRIVRGGEKVEFALQEAEDVKKALAEAKAGEAWFKKLLSAEVPPAPTPTVRPPKSGGYQLRSKLGEVPRRRGLGFEISVAAYFLMDQQFYYTEHGVRFVSSDGTEASMSGEWVEHLLAKVSEALGSIASAKPYSFKSDKNDAPEYTVTADPATQEADVVVTPSNSPSPWRGRFERVELAQIEKLTDAAKQRTKWFEEHESLFFARPPK